MVLMLIWYSFMGQTNLVPEYLRKRTLPNLDSLEIVVFQYPVKPHPDVLHFMSGTGY